MLLAEHLAERRGVFFRIRIHAPLFVFSLLRLAHNGPRNCCGGVVSLLYPSLFVRIIAVMISSVLLGGCVHRESSCQSPDIRLSRHVAEAHQSPDADCPEGTSAPHPKHSIGNGVSNGLAGKGLDLRPGKNVVEATRHFAGNVCADHKEFYSSSNMTRLALGVGLHGVLANTNADQQLHDRYQRDIRSSSTDHVSACFKPFGDGHYFIPAFLALAAGGAALSTGESPNVPFTYGERVLRGYTVGAPPMLALQYILGASRPTEGDLDESHWLLLRDTNSVSGHAFMGSVPFITGANMVQNPWLKSLLYSCSALPALSRINDNDHYPSQALLGWWIGYLACDSVASSVMKTRSSWELFPIVSAQNTGLGVSIKW